MATLFSGSRPRLGASLQPIEIADGECRLNVNQQRRRQKHPAGVAPAEQRNRAISHKRAVTYGQGDGALSEPRASQAHRRPKDVKRLNPRSGLPPAMPDAPPRGRLRRLSEEAPDRAAPPPFFAFPTAQAGRTASTRPAAPLNAAGSRASTRSTESCSYRQSAWATNSTSRARARSCRAFFALCSAIRTPASGPFRSSLPTPARTRPLRYPRPRSSSPSPEAPSPRHGAAQCAARSPGIHAPATR